MQRSKLELEGEGSHDMHLDREIHFTRPGKCFEFMTKET
jgi:hypothetical protein